VIVWFNNLFLIVFVIVSSFQAHDDFYFLCLMDSCVDLV
jgi:hypothetical protein